VGAQAPKLTVQALTLIFPKDNFWWHLCGATRVQVVVVVVVVVVDVRE